LTDSSLSSDSPSLVVTLSWRYSS